MKGDGKYEATLTLTKHGKAKTWLLSGWDKIETAGGIGKVSASTAPTQGDPTFSREALGAAISDANLRRVLDTAKGEAREKKQYSVTDEPRRDDESAPRGGDFDLVWGEPGTARSDGFGLSKILKYHPEVAERLQEVLDSMQIETRRGNRIQLSSDSHKASVRLDWNGEKKNWLLTAFEKEEAGAKTMNTGTDRTSGIQNDTAPLKSSSTGEDTEIIGTSDGSGEENIQYSVAHDERVHHAAHVAVRLLQPKVRSLLAGLRVKTPQGVDMHGAKVRQTRQWSVYYIYGEKRLLSIRQVGICRRLKAPQQKANLFLRGES